MLPILQAALGVFTDLDVEWWEDSYLTCGEELTPGIVDRLDEADYGRLGRGRPHQTYHDLEAEKTSASPTEPGRKLDAYRAWAPVERRPPPDGAGHNTMDP